MERREQITIDGPAASGKSTVANAVADRLDACYVNTGEMYRALTWLAVDNGLDPEVDAAAIVHLLKWTDLVLKPDTAGDHKHPTLYLNRHPVDIDRIRAPTITAKVSFTAKIPEVREWMLSRQRKAALLGLIVMEGRDIGTVVFPRAKHKFFVTASAAARASRRLAQSGETVNGSTLDSVTREIEARDKMDSTRKIAPLKPAADAQVIDTTELTVEQVVNTIESVIRRCWQKA